MNDSYLAHSRLWLWFVLSGVEEAIFVDRLKEAQWSLEVLSVAVVLPSPPSNSHGGSGMTN